MEACDFEVELEISKHKYAMYYTYGEEDWETELNKFVESLCPTKSCFSNTGYTKEMKPWGKSESRLNTDYTMNRKYFVV